MPRTPSTPTPTFELPIPKEYYPDDYETFVFGPYAAADFNVGDEWNKLPFHMDKDFVIDSVRVKASTKTSQDGTNFALCWKADGSASGTGAAPVAYPGTGYSRATEVVDLNDMVNNTSMNVPVQPTSGNERNANIVPANGDLYVWTAASATALAGFYIFVRGRTAKK